MTTDRVDIFLQDIEVPDIVQKKARDAFSIIRMESNEEQGKIMKHNKNKKGYPFGMTRAAAIVAATLIGGGSITAVAAAYMHWSRGMQSEMNVSEEQMLELQNMEDTPLSFPEVSDTQGDITVSMAQCLLDDNTIRLAFYIDGYELPTNEEPQLESLNILLDGKPANNIEWSFYTGIDRDENGNPVMADGSAVKVDADGGLIPNYRIADGKMELDLTMSPVDEKGKAISNLAGKVITIQMENIGETAGPWTLEWTLAGTTTVVEKELSEVLGESGATVTKVTLSPISIKVCYDFVLQEIMETAIDEKGNEIEVSNYKEPPQLIGVKMKDGTVYMGIMDGGASGYEDTESSAFIAEVRLSRILNPKEVQSLLFLRDDISISVDQEITEAQCYSVDLN